MRTAEEWKTAARRSVRLQQEHDGGIGDGTRTGTLMKRWHEGVSWDAIEEGMWPSKVSMPTADITMGRWKGNFLDNGDAGNGEPWYISTTLAAWPPDRRQRYYDYVFAQGWTHVVVAAAVSDWGPSRGNPDYTMGGFNAHRSDAKLNRLVRVLSECRNHGLIPVVSVFEQMELRNWSIGKLIQKAQRLVDVTAPFTCMYQLAWEHTYALPVSSSRRSTEDALLSSVDWRGRDVGLHYQPALPTYTPGEHDLGLSGGITRYRQMRDLLNNGRYVVRLMQYAREASLETLRDQTRAAMVVHGHGPGQHKLGGFCAFEFSANIRLSHHSQELWQQRREAIMDVVRSAQMPADRSGFLN